MFDIGALELLLIVIVAIIVIGPKDMPQALRTAGKWVGKIRKASAQFRNGFDNLVREAEMEDMEKKWKEQNAKIMAETPEGEMGPLHASEVGESSSDSSPNAASAEARSAGETPAADAKAAVSADNAAEPKQNSKKAAPKKPLVKKTPTAKKPTAKKPADKRQAGDEPMLPLGKSGDR